MPEHFLNFEGTSFGPLISGQLTSSDPDCLFYHKQPMLWLAKDQTDRNWVVMLLDDDRSKLTSLAVCISFKEAEALRNADKANLADAINYVYSSPVEGWVVVEDEFLLVESYRPALAEDYAMAKPRVSKFH